MNVMITRDFIILILNKNKYKTGEWWYYGIGALLLKKVT